MEGGRSTRRTRGTGIPRGRGTLALAVLAFGLVGLLPWTNRLAAHTPVPIEEGFGLKLGETFVPSQSSEPAITLNGSVGYFFTPAHPSPLFDSYVVQITPVSHRIHTIIGVGTRENLTTCQSDRSSLLPRLTKTYGASVTWKPDPASGITIDYEIILQADHQRAIGVSCGGTSPIIFQIMYLDNDLSNVAHQELLQVARLHPQPPLHLRNLNFMGNGLPSSCAFDVIRESILFPDTLLSRPGREGRCPFGTDSQGFNNEDQEGHERGLT